MRSLLLVPALVFGLGLARPAQSMETLWGFEGGWPSGGWVNVEAPVGTVGAAAAHDGLQGLIGDVGWSVNTGFTVGATWERLSLWVRTTSAGSGNGRVYLGFDAGPAGCTAFTFSPATGDVRFQQITAGYTSYTQLNVRSFTPTVGQWVRLEVEFLSSSAVVGRVFDSDGVTVLQAVEQALPAAMGSGVAVRVLGTAMHADTLGRYDPGMADSVCTTIAEDFESVASPPPGWVTAVGNSGLTSTFAAHDGTRGYTGDGGWEVNEQILTGVPGTRLSLWTRAAAGAGVPTRTYLGFSADAVGGCYAFVLAGDTNQILFQDWRGGWVGVDLGSTPFTVLTDRWYRLEVEFLTPYEAIGRVFDSDGSTELASYVQRVPFGFGVGGVAVRSDLVGRMHLDTLERHGPPLLEGFEAPWPASGWVRPAGGTPGITSTGAARDGERGYEAPFLLGAWELSTSLQYGNPGERLSMWVRDGGAAWLGFGATAGGAYSFVFNPGGGRVFFQDNTSWGGVDLNSVDFVHQPGLWYRVEVEFVDPVTVAGRVYGPDGSTGVVTLFQALPPGVLPGGVAFRGSLQASIDNLEDWTVGASCGCSTFCGDCDGNGLGPNITDALASAQIAAGILAPSGEEMICCDTDSSGDVSVLDALAMAQAAVGLPVTLMCP